MILSDKEIVEELRLGNINISPFNPEQVQPNSYDFRLGNWICRQKNPIKPKNYVYNPYYDKEGIWENPIDMYTFVPALQLLSIHPGELVLAHSLEVLGGLNSITTEMKTRSSMARIGIDVCKSAGVGDVGYNNIWTLEITNNSNWTIHLPVGCRIGQMLFIRTGPTEKKYSGSYLQKPEWSPLDMLPKFNPNKL